MNLIICAFLLYVATCVNTVKKEKARKEK